MTIRSGVKRTRRTKRYTAVSVIKNLRIMIDWRDMQKHRYFYTIVVNATKNSTWHQTTVATTKVHIPTPRYPPTLKDKKLYQAPHLHKHLSMADLYTYQERQPRSTTFQTTNKIDAAIDKILDDLTAPPISNYMDLLTSPINDDDINKILTNVQTSIPAYPKRQEVLSSSTPTQHLSSNLYINNILRVHVPQIHTYPKCTNTINRS